MFPADSLVDKRDAFGSSSSEENRRDWHLVRCPTSVLLREHRYMMGHQDDNMVKVGIYISFKILLSTPRGSCHSSSRLGQLTRGEQNLEVGVCESSAP